MAEKSNKSISLVFHFIRELVIHFILLCGGETSG